MPRKDHDRTYREVLIAVIALLALPCAMGLFALFQVSQLKTDLSRLSAATTGVVAALAHLEASKAGILDVAERLGGTIVPAGLGQEQVKHERASLAVRLKELHGEHRDTLAQIQEFAERLGAAAEGEREAMEQIISRAAREQQRVATLLEMLEREEHSMIERSLTEVIHAAPRGLLELGQDMQTLVSAFGARTAMQSRSYEVWVMVEVAVVTLVCLVLGGLVILRLRSLQERVIEHEQLIALAKISVTLQHEINNPLSIIVGNAYIARALNIDEQERVKAIGDIEAAARRIADVVERTRNLERLATTNYLAGEEMVDLSLPPPGNRAS